MIPEDWSELLADTMLTDSFVEAAVHVLRLEVGDYRNALVAFENRARQMLGHPDRDEMVSIVTALDKLNADWRAKQSDAATHLDANKGNLGPLMYLGDSIETVLIDQGGAIEAATRTLAGLELAGDLAVDYERLLDEFGALLDLAHSLRDMMLEMFMAIARSADKLDEIDDRATIDALTGLANRTGVEVVLHKWVCEDPERERAASAALLDIDAMGAINRRIGADPADHLLGELGQVIEGLTRQNRGYDVTARFAGQLYFVFFGDTGPRGAVHAVERMRQTLEASKVTGGDDELSLTVSAGVVEFTAAETTDDLIRRLLAALRCAKEQGGNQTFVDEGNGAELVTPPKLALPGRTIDLGG
ncbi:MAG: GGDEF domain-containing protein [Pirellulales bacterium]